MTSRITVIDLPILTSLPGIRPETAEPAPEPAQVPADVACLPEPGERLVVGTHRLAPPERACPAWPRLRTVHNAQIARYRSWYLKAPRLPGWSCRLASRRTP